MPQYWDDVLYPSFRATIRGEYYGIVTIDDIDEECYNIAKRAIAAFKFPRISTQYVTYYAIRSEDPDENNTLEEVDEDTEGAIPHAYFVNNLSYAELEVILAWMKFYWCEEQISNADNFEDIYTDSNIKTYSRANAVAQNLKMMQYYRQTAQELETRYSRVNGLGKPSMGDINKDE